MNTFYPRYPNFIDAPAEAKVPFQFNTIEELYQCQRIKDIKSWPDFSHFEKSNPYLMAITTENKHFVVGWFDNTDKIDLPIWQNKVTIWTKIYKYFKRNSIRKIKRKS